ncbi:94_t:CDS:2 [Cetraspora pellucida]|uniref:DNA-directed RNA polymerase n=1 Tax=Cetraspora pellucida TaxID=1433469 RepID=A0A9N9JNQ2_9GLOM|nr:94_t:CDS:2 [Cetraspora pellucida]
MQFLPVIPCGLRPATQLKEENTIATTQLNNLYRHVILINDLVKNYLELNKQNRIFPLEVEYNVKRRLQEAVDKLLLGSPQKTKEVKSLLQSLSGKEGILRHYSLGKRVDYSGRSVITPNPHLQLNQVEKSPMIFPLLNEIVRNHPLLVNRAPTLHRLGIQGFYPHLTLGRSLELHPLVTTAFNADFDGDQMNLHVPLTPDACQETKNYILASHNLLDPKNGSLITIPSKDMILGIYCYEKGELAAQELIVVPACLVARNLAEEKNKFLFTTYGKLLFNKILPPNFPYYLNDLTSYGEKDLKEIITFLNYLVHHTNQEEMDELETQLTTNLAAKKDTSFYNIWDSGARASSENLTQIFAFRGNTTDYRGEIGLSADEFLISSIGAIKGITDVALKTGEAVYGRFLAQNITDEEGKIILPLRSVMCCELIIGVCQKCYGADLTRHEEMISLGAAVGIIAAQSLGEPGTQLTMRTFHTGGIAGEEDDITQGIPKVKQILDNLKPNKNEKAVLAKTNGTISVIDEKTIKQTDLTGQEITYSRTGKKSVLVQVGEQVVAGAKLTLGKIDLEEYLSYVGRENYQNYIKETVQQVYYNQGIDIADKHLEIFAHQILSRVKVLESGDSDYLVGEIINYQKVRQINQELIAQQKKPLLFKNIVSSLKDLASNTNSFWAGISFQNTLKSLVNYSLYQPIDYLHSPKECLITGQLIPVGTGFEERQKLQQSQKR